MKFFKQTILVICLLLSMAGQLTAKTSNGNDFALYYTEARSDAERKMLLDDAKGRPHFFRYLQIMEIEKTSLKGRPYIKIVAFEPSSALDVHFSVTKSNSLKKLWAEPTTKKGDAIAITGVIKSVDTTAIHVGPVIVRHKDRLTPKRGKEMMYEVDASAVFYSYTGGDTAVSLGYQDRDLIKHKGAIIASGGNQAWTDFLIKEKAKRDKARAKAVRANIKSQLKEHK